ncbi:MAG: oligosaccharide flippase family protein [Bacteroidaceae bacterium]|nr:oligosaccharide flippase family protein [Bacteroidaceae bacterium]
MAGIFSRIKETDARTALVRKNILFSFLIKGWSALVMFLLVPITLKCLGEYTNGVWLTISSMLIWIDQMDIGLGNGLRNQLASAIAHGDKVRAKEVVSSTFFMLIIIIIPVLLVLVSLIFTMDMYSFLNVEHDKISNLPDVIAVATILICSTFIFKFISSFYQGMQLPAVSNLFLTIGHTLTLIATYIAYSTGFRSLMVIAIINTAGPLLIYITAYPLTFFRKYRDISPSYRYFTFASARSLFTVGVKFFVLQMAGVVLFMSSNIVISNILNPAEVTPYQIAYRYFTLCLILFNIISTPYWSATTDAYERGDIEWIRNSRRRMKKVLFGMIAIAALMVAASPIVYHIWIGDDVTIPFLLTILVAVYLLVLIISMSYSNFIFGIGTLKIQLIFTISAAVLFIPLAYLLSNIEQSIYAVVLAMILINLPGLIANRIQLNKLLKGKATGIWKE